MNSMRIQNIYLIASDTERLKRFYEEAFQFPVKFADGTRWVQFSVGGANIAIAAPEEAPEGAKGPIVVFEVADIISASESAINAGARPLGERDMGSHGRTAAFADPEGNVFQLFARQTQS